MVVPQTLASIQKDSVMGVPHTKEAWPHTKEVRHNRVIQVVEFSYFCLTDKLHL